jgi:hypothetical protein
MEEEEPDTYMEMKGISGGVEHMTLFQCSYYTYNQEYTTTGCGLGFNTALITCDVFASNGPCTCVPCVTL